MGRHAKRVIAPPLRYNKGMWKPLRVCVCLLALVTLAGCAGVAPVPGGSESSNQSSYKTAEDFRAKVARLQPGMPENLVMSILERDAHDMTALSRAEIVTALYGGSAMQMLDSAREREQTRHFLQGLSGYHFVYRDVEKSHGLSSPIRISTKEHGFEYRIDLIFQNGVLLEKPVIAGGMINDTSSRTIFDYINPGTMIAQAR